MPGTSIRPNSQGVGCHDSRSTLDRGHESPPCDCCRHSIAPLEDAGTLRGSQTTYITDGDAGDQGSDDYDAGETAKWDPPDALEVVMILHSDALKKPSAPRNIYTSVDSGAAEVVAPPSFALEYRVKPSAVLRSGAKYHLAMGDVVANHGEKRVSTNRIRRHRMMNFQITDVAKPVASAGTTTGRRHKRVLHDDEMYAQHKETERNAELQKKGNACVMMVQLMPPPGGWRDITRQED